MWRSSTSSVSRASTSAVPLQLDSRGLTIANVGTRTSNVRPAQAVQAGGLPARPGRSDPRARGSPSRWHRGRRRSASRTGRPRRPCGLQWLEPSLTAGKARAVPVHAVGGDPCAIVDPARRTRPASRITYVGGRPRAEGADRGDGGGLAGEARGGPRGGLPVRDAAADPVVPDRDGRRRPGVPPARPADRRLGRAERARVGGLRIRRRRGHGRVDREAVRPLSMGPLRHPGPAARASPSAGWRTRS